MPANPLAYAPALPTIDANGIVGNLEFWLQSPARVRRVVQELTNQRFIADVIFGTGPRATGGAVEYDQVTASDLFLDRDVQEIAPGADYPDLTDTAPTPKMAGVKKWGGRAGITDEQRDRNQWNIANRETTKLGNTIIRKVDRVAVATLEAAPILTDSGSNWSNPSTGDPIGDIVVGRQLSHGLDMGYELDTVLINSQEEASLLAIKTFRESLSDASKDAIVRGANLGKVMRMDFIVSNQVTPGTAYLLQRRMVGGISDEVPLQVKTYREEKADKTWIQGSRRLVPYVTDPKAVVKLTGLHG